MVAILFILAIAMFLFARYLNSSADKMEQRVADAPSVITNPARDLQKNQKYAIVRLLAMVQGASSFSAYDEHASQIVKSTIFSLGLSQGEVEKVLKVTSNRSVDFELRQIEESLKEIKDRRYLNDIMDKCSEIAEISNNEEIKEYIFELSLKL